MKQKQYHYRSNGSGGCGCKKPTCGTCSTKQTPNKEIAYEPSSLVITNGAGMVTTNQSKYYFDNNGNLHIVGDIFVETLHYNNLNPPINPGGMFTIRLAAGVQTYQNDDFIGLDQWKIKAWSAGMELTGSPIFIFNNVTGEVDFGFAPTDFTDLWAVTG